MISAAPGTDDYLQAGFDIRWMLGIFCPNRVGCKPHLESEFRVTAGLADSRDLSLGRGRIKAIDDGPPCRLIPSRVVTLDRRFVAEFHRNARQDQYRKEVGQEPRSRAMPARSRPARMPHDSLIAMEFP